MAVGTLDRTGLADVFFVAQDVHSVRASDVTRAVTGAVIHHVNIFRRSPSSQNAGHRLADAEALVFRRNEDTHAHNSNLERSANVTCATELGPQFPAELVFGEGCHVWCRRDTNATCCIRPPSRTVHSGLPHLGSIGGAVTYARL